MIFGERVFLYCERGANEAMLAEPANALSNVAFLLAALAGFAIVLRRPPEERDADQFLLPALVLFIGLGSLAFHLCANRAAELADVVPISVFMLVYLGFALNRFLGIPPAWTVLLVIGFTAVLAITGQVKCGEGVIGFLGPDAKGATPCLNGSVFYLPALAALIVIGLNLSERRHKAAPWLLWAAAIFAVSITLRSLDLALCDQLVIEGRKIGTHAAWHMLNALMLFLLLRASLEGGPNAVGAPPRMLPASEQPAGTEPEERPTPKPEEAETPDAERSQATDEKDERKPALAT
jgi:Ceramidase